MEAVLGIAMVVSIFATLYFGRGTTFSGDEMVWVVTSPQLDLDTALQPHAGHLLLVSRLLYAPLLDLFGLDYLPYRILTVLSVCLTVGLLFVYLRRRVPEVVALVPCLVLLFFGSDHLHMLQGNGFTICFSLAMGLLALLMVERDDRAGDVIASIALVAAVATYAVGLPFVVGIAAAVALKRQWRRLWIPAIPAVLYLAWLLWTKTNDAGGPGSQVEFSNLTLIPKWSFQALGAALYALTGLSFDLTRGDSIDLIGTGAALLAIAAILAVAICVWRGRASRGLWVAIAIGVALWTMQALVSGTGGRLPDDARYLYPGAVVSVLVLAEAARGLRWRRPTLIALYLIGAIGLTTNFLLLERNGDFYRDLGLAFRGQVGAANLIVEAQASAGSLEEDSVPLDELVTEEAGAAFAMADLPYGHFGLTPLEMTALPPEQRISIDRGLIAAEELELFPAADANGKDCRKAPESEDGIFVAELGPDGGILHSRSGIKNLLAGRFADAPHLPLEKIEPGETVKLEVLPDSGSETVPWQVQGSGRDIEICGL
ncbi:MAG TPA: hypothetical protein VMF31_03620 [Solirubrobacterales bacterium]|nr:hypothetical protein [Solirubrobacterales bacterium]